jgi:hypothetical protein
VSGLCQTVQPLMWVDGKFTRNISFFTSLVLFPAVPVSNIYSTFNILNSVRLRYIKSKLSFLEVF